MFPRVALLVGLFLFGHVAASSASPQVRQLTSASSEFSQNLYGEVALNQPNAIFSPFSAHTCLSMVLLGARGSTADEMVSALELDGVTNVEQVHPAYSQLIEDLNSVPGVKLLVANGIFVSPNFQIKPQFEQAVTNQYFAEADNIDLQASGGPQAPINAWVASKTENKITDVLQPGTVDANTVMVLVNTVFFNGTWARKFDPRATSKQSFYKSDGSEVEVDLMHQTKRFPYKGNAIPGVDVVSLPFRNGRFSLVVALPRSGTDLSSLETYISDNADNLDDLFEGLQGRPVDLYLPKFKLTATMDLIGPLQNLGMNEAFTGGADFSGIADANLMITEAIQKATIEVREEGTVAAAATAIAALRTSAMFGDEPVVFRADRPFLYFLRDADTGLILFQGKLADPDIEEINV